MPTPSCHGPRFDKGHHAGLHAWWTADCPHVDGRGAGRYTPPTQPSPLPRHTVQQFYGHDPDGVPLYSQHTTDLIALGRQLADRAHRPDPLGAAPGLLVDGVVIVVEPTEVLPCSPAAWASLIRERLRCAGRPT